MLIAGFIYDKYFRLLTKLNPTARHIKGVRINIFCLTFPYHQIFIGFNLVLVL